MWSNRTRRTCSELALVLFDALGERLGLRREDRAALADAALLHDAGYHISYERHHKHSYHLILHADLLGMSPSEQVVIANVARYHRGEAEAQASKLRHARQDAAAADQATVGDAARRRRVRSRPRQRGRRSQGAMDAARAAHHAGAGESRAVDAPRDVGRQPQVRTARRPRRRAGGDRRRDGRVLSSDEIGTSEIE